MKKLKTYIIVICFIVPLLVLFLPAATSCNPHRKGATAKQIGASGGKKYHTKTASAKRRRKKKY